MTDQEDEKVAVEEEEKKAKKDKGKEGKEGKKKEKVISAKHCENPCFSNTKKGKEKK